jgi:hypothetical protein
MDAPIMAKGVSGKEDAAPSAGGASAGWVSSDEDWLSEPVPVALPPVVTVESPVPLAPEVVVALPLGLRDSLVRPSVEVAESIEVEPTRGLDVVLDSMADEVEDLAKTAWMRISWHWSPIHSS